MHVCLSCNHLLVFHKAPGEKEPCYLCPPAQCLVEGCRCHEYKGMLFTDRPHEVHKHMRVHWGSWGFVVFASDEERIFVSGAEPVIERVGIRFKPGA